jgi:hypothetical protein
MEIRDNKKLWFHRRLIAYMCFLSVWIALILSYIATPEKMQYLKEIFWLFIGGCFLYIICYSILATIHDGNLLPKILDILKK